MKIVADSYAWVELFIGSDKGKVVKEKMGKADEVYTPDVVLAELARKYHRENVAAHVIEERLSRIYELSRLIPIDRQIAIKAAELDLELRKRAKETGLREPSLFDAIVMAAAEVLGANLMTGDEHFKGRHEVIWLGR